MTINAHSTLRHIRNKAPFPFGFSAPLHPFNTKMATFEYLYIGKKSSVKCRFFKTLCTNYIFGKFMKNGAFFVFMACSESL
jgi:hypothetical protein